MAKVKKASLSNALVSAGMGVVGGMAANLVDTKLMSTSSVYTKAGIKAAVGVALPMVLGGSITESLGASMVGVAGYQLAEELLGELMTLLRLPSEVDSKEIKVKGQINYQYPPSSPVNVSFYIFMSEQWGG